MGRPYDHLWCRPISGGCQGELAPGGRHEPGSGSKVRNSSDEIASARCEEIAAEVRASPGPGARRRSGSISGRQRAVALTADPARRAERVLAAAEASLQAGAFNAALGLLATVDTGALDESQRARLDLVRGHVAWASGLGSQASPLLLSAGRRLERLDAELARHMYITAWFAATQPGPIPQSRCRRSLTPSWPFLSPPGRVLTTYFSMA
jgi:hypothetical protein